MQTDRTIQLTRPAAVIAVGLFLVLLRAGWMYPILYPAMLAAVWLVWPTFPDNIAAMPWLPLASVRNGPKPVEWKGPWSIGWSSLGH